MFSCQQHVHVFLDSMAETTEKKPVTCSQELLSCGDGEAIHEKLLLKKPSKPASLQTTRVPRSSVLDRLQSFLPQIAQANESLKQQMEATPAEQFDIENIDDAEKIIEMDVALFEMNNSDGDSDPSEDDSSEDSSDSEEDEQQEEEGEEEKEKLKLPGDCKRKRRANIEVLATEDV